MELGIIIAIITALLVAIFQDQLKSMGHRFVDLIRNKVSRNRSNSAPGSEGKPRCEPAPQRVVVAIVQQGLKVILVRRQPNAEGLGWMFPSGFLKPGEDPQQRALGEVLDETGVTCTAVSIVGVLVHPLTGSENTYVHCTYRQGKLRNTSPGENAQVSWIEAAEVGDYIPEIADTRVRELLTRIAADGKA